MFHCNYLAPRSMDEFLTALHQHGGEAKVIAGGTDLIPQMRLGKLAPRVLIDPRHLFLSGIIEDVHGIQLGASVTHTQVLDSLGLQKGYPALVNACQQVGGTPVRNRGTLAGNLANASPAADSALPLFVYDAELVISRLGGVRVIPLNEFYKGSGQTVLSEDEFIQYIRIPKPPPYTRAVFLKLGKRQAMAIALASVAVQVSFAETGQICGARIALGSVAPMPVRAYQAESILLSNSPDDELIRQASQAARLAASPISDLRAGAEYRSQMVEVLTRRALNIACSHIAQELRHG
jgi:aerobic carbon-monoxide dehydrogenase medium subunit